MHQYALETRRNWLSFFFSFPSVIDIITKEKLFQQFPIVSCYPPQVTLCKSVMLCIFLTKRTHSFQETLCSFLSFFFFFLVGHRILFGWALHSLARWRWTPLNGTFSFPFLLLQMQLEVLCPKHTLGHAKRSTTSCDVGGNWPLGMRVSFFCFLYLRWKFPYFVTLRKLITCCVHGMGRHQCVIIFICKES